MNKTWVKNPLAIFAPEGVEAGGGLVVQDAEIVETVPGGQKPSTPCERVFDAGDHVVLPGLINAHHHFYQTLTRALPAALDKELFPWLQTLYPIWSGLTPEHVAVSTRLALAELLLSGCTTASDHHYVFPPGLEQAIDIQIAEARNLGIRVALARGSMSLGQQDGGLPPEGVIQDANTILTDSERLVSQYHRNEPGAMQQIILAPCSPFSVTSELMIETARLARSHGVQLHTHLAETHDETRYCLDLFGVRPVDYLERVEWVAADVWLAHGIHFDTEEIQRLGSAGVGICHCPSSNMVLASGMCPALELEAAGSPVGLGVDGSASNDSSNLIQEARQALMLQRLKYGSSKVSHRHALHWATRGSARCLGREDLGELSTGKQADLALFKLDELRFSGAGDPLAALVLCGAHQADHVMVAGKWVVESGEIPGLDLPGLMIAHSQLAGDLLK